MVGVTKPFLPDINRYKKYVDKIYKSGWITNDGFLVRELEEKLSEYLGVKNIVLVANGTLALEIAYVALEVKRTITTPFSFVATVSSMVMHNIEPIFVDINPKTFLLDENKIEEVIDENVSAIVPVHVFGNGCRVEEIDKIAKKYNLKVIYDAAQAFGIKYKDKSILNYGDISTLSFHATKVFHTIEGGAIVVNDDDLVEKIRYMKNFGYKDYKIKGVGINAKMNEFEAAMGLCVLEDIDLVLERREELWWRYYRALEGMFEFQKREFVNNNYGYFPILFRSEEDLIRVEKRLNRNNIFPRRYFYPSLDTLDYVESKALPISRDISKRVLCLPIYFELSNEIQDKIIKEIKDECKNV